MKVSKKAEHELVPLEENASFTVREFKLPRFTSPWHLHSECEITLILSGRGKRFVGDSVSGFSAGDLVMIGEGLPHYWCSSDSVKEKAHSIVIQFKNNCLGEGFFDRPEMKPIKNLQARCRRGIRFQGKARELIPAKLLAMRKASGFQRIQGFLAILDILAKSKDYRFLASEGFLAVADGWRDKRISKACQFVFDNLTEPISLGAVARTAGMHKDAFCRFFRKMTGQTLFEFINNTRVGHACALLIDTDMNITEACYASGFNNLSNFNRRFKITKGMTPKQFRKIIAAP